jgi:hypothetical protein
MNNELFFNIFGGLIFGTIFVTMIIAGIVNFKKYKKKLSDNSCIETSDKVFAYGGLYGGTTIGVIGIICVICALCGVFN